tara:strand:+ start:4782 stop:4988 length:207 start_codon:yes stop_codon:yes gene_type:complete
LLCIVEFLKDFVTIINRKIINFGETQINKGERIKKSKLASLRRKVVRSIKKKKIEKIYRELRKAKKNK